MNKSDRSEIRDSLANVADETVDCTVAIASLRMVGADRFDPVRFRYIEALANRLMAHQGSVKRILDGKLADELTAFRDRFEQEQNDVRNTITHITPQYPHAGDDLQRLFVAGNFSGVRQSIATLKKSSQRASLGDLTRYIAQHSHDDVDDSLDEHVESRCANSAHSAHSELKTIRHFRNTWSKLSVERQVTQALDQAPKNAGPLNSHMLVLRSLALMRDLSPEYLNRFMSYVDTLLCLDQVDKNSKPAANKPLKVQTKVKMKVRRDLPR